MSTEATCTIHITSWNETPYTELEGRAKLARVSATHRYQGDIEGEGKVEYLLAYTVNGSASFVGIEHVTGSIEGREGSFVLQHVGSFEGERSRSTWVVVPGAGTGELSALRGDGNTTAGQGEPATVFIRYGFEPVLMAAHGQ